MKLLIVPLPQLGNYSDEKLLGLLQSLSKESFPDNINARRKIAYLNQHFDVPSKSLHADHSRITWRKSNALKLSLFG